MCFVIVHSKVSMKCHALLGAAVLVLSVDSSITENTQKAVEKRISLTNQAALLSHAYFKEGAACELAGNWRQNWAVHWAHVCCDGTGWEVVQSGLPCENVWVQGETGRNRLISGFPWWEELFLCSRQEQLCQITSHYLFYYPGTKWIHSSLFYSVLCLPFSYQLMMYCFILT